MKYRAAVYLASLAHIVSFSNSNLLLSAYDVTDLMILSLTVIDSSLHVDVTKKLVLWCESSKYLSIVNMSTLN